MFIMCGVLTVTLPLLRHDSRTHIFVKTVLFKSRRDVF
jgi:hypothetical protein